MGKHFAPDFQPELSPQQMLEMGVFRGNYFEGEYDEFPESWFKNAHQAGTHTTDMNFYGVDASQSRKEWQKKGWIYEEDPRGWFQWYCRYYLGRRIVDEDRRQINRWKNMQRHIAQIKKYCQPGDLHCRRRQRQALLHWAYDSTKM